MKNKKIYVLFLLVLLFFMSCYNTIDKDNVLIVSRITRVNTNESSYLIEICAGNGVIGNISYCSESNKFNVGDTLYIKK
jgi:hypothetical protein